MNYKKIVGDFGEQIAKDFLERRGYKIVAKNIKTSYKEIDIIAEKDDVIIFVEVKTRTSDKFGVADEAITGNKLKNIQEAIELYLYNNNLELKNARIDLISIDINKLQKTANIKHYKGVV